MPEHHFATPRPVRLEVRVAAGDVNITTVDGEQTTVTITGSSKLTDAMRVELIGDRLVVEQRRKALIPWFARWEDPLRVTAAVPHGSQAEIATAASDVAIDGTLGGLELKSASGVVSATGAIDGDARVNTVSGDVRLPRVAGDVNLHTVSGDISAEAVAGSVVVKAVSGNVWLGSVHDGRVQVQSVSGDVEVGIAADTSIDVDAGSASGKLSSEVPLAATPSEERGPEVVIRGNTVSGDFRVFRAA